MASRSMEFFWDFIMDLLFIIVNIFATKFCQMMNSLGLMGHIWLEKDKRDFFFFLKRWGFKTTFLSP